MSLAAISASVPRGPEVTLTCRAAKARPPSLSAKRMKIVLDSWLARLQYVLTPAPPCPAVTVPFVCRKTMLPGAGARLASRRTPKASVPLCAKASLVVLMPSALFHPADPPVLVLPAHLAILSRAAAVCLKCVQLLTPVPSLFRVFLDNAGRDVTLPLVESMLPVTQAQTNASVRMALWATETFCVCRPSCHLFVPLAVGHTVTVPTMCQISVFVMLDLLATLMRVVSLS